MWAEESEIDRRMNPLSLNPEWQKLADEIALLREELAKLLTETDNLMRIVKPNLLALYQTKIGTWELRLLEAKCALARLKRKIELAQARLNQGRKPDWTEIEGQLDLEFLQWQAELKETVARIEAAQSRLQHLLPAAETHELKKLYRALARKLHPDLNPRQGEDAGRLWLRVQDAYEAGDLEELKALALLADAFAEIPLPSAIEALQEQRPVLEKQIASKLAQIEQVQAQPPFTLRRQLQDEEWLTERRQQIKSQIEETERARAALEKHCQTLLKETGNGSEPGTH